MKIASATQTRTKPASSAGGIGSPSTNTPQASCRTGAAYCRMPEAGHRDAVGRVGEEQQRYRGDQPGRDQQHGVRRGHRGERGLPRARSARPGRRGPGSASTDDSTSRPSVGGRPRRFFTRPYEPNETASVSAIQGSRP